MRDENWGTEGRREKKKFNKRLILPITLAILALIGIIVVLVLLSKLDDKPAGGKGKGSSASSEDDGDREEPEDTPTPTPSPTPTPTPCLESIAEENLFGIDGFEYFRDADEIRDTNMYLMASFTELCEKDDEYIYYVNLIECTEDYVIFEYQHGDKDSHGEDDYDGIYNESLTTTYVRMEVESGDTEEISFNVDEAGMEYAGGYFLMTVYGDETEYILYDKEFKTLIEFETDDSSTGVKVNGNGSKLYYIDEDGTVCHVDEDGDEGEVEINENIIVSYLSDVLTIDDTDYLIVSARGGDMKYYTVILNAETGKAEYISDNDNSYCSSSETYFVKSKYDEGNLIDSFWLFAGPEGRTYDFYYETPEDQGFYVWNTTAAGDIVFYRLAEKGIIVHLFDGATGRLKDADYLKLSAKQLGAYGTESSVWVQSGFIEVRKDEFLFVVMNADCSTDIYKWIIDGEQTAECEIACEGHVMGTEPSCEISDEFDISYYTPREVSEELEPLKERAEELEDELGFEIYIGDECRDYIGGYTIDPLLDYDSVEEALDILEKELSKYPDGFFDQVLPEYLDENAIYIASTLTGKEDNTVGIAAGFRTDYDGKQLIVIDASVWGIEATLHHEISHIIDDFVLRKSADSGEEYFTEYGWAGFNPDGFTYTWSYSDYDYNEDSELTFMYQYMNGDEEYEKVYFYDSYAMTYATEDRARLFENVMAGYLLGNLDEMPYLKAKMDYYAQGIRKAFDTTGWQEELEWEKY